MDIQVKFEDMIFTETIKNDDLIFKLDLKKKCFPSLDSAFNNLKNLDICDEREKEDVQFKEGMKEVTDQYHFNDVIKFADLSFTVSHLTCSSASFIDPVLLPGITNILKLNNISYQTKLIDFVSSLNKKTEYDIPYTNQDLLELFKTDGYNYESVLYQVKGKKLNIVSIKFIPVSNNYVFEFDSIKLENEIMIRTFSSLKNIIDTEKPEVSKDTNDLINNFLKIRGKVNILKRPPPQQESDLENPTKKKKQNSKNFTVMQYKYLDNNDLFNIATVPKSIDKFGFSQSKNLKFFVDINFLGKKKLYRDIVKNLKSNFQIDLIERDFNYQKLEVRNYEDKQNSESHRYFSIDFVLDFKSCLIIFPLNLLNQNKKKKKFENENVSPFEFNIYLYQNLIHLFKFKFNSISVLFELFDDEVLFPFTLPVQNAIKNFQNFKDFLFLKYKLNLSYFFFKNLTECCFLIRNVAYYCENELNSHPSQQFKDFFINKNDWLMEEESPQERLLSAIPYINPIQSQIILRLFNRNLKLFLGLDYETFCEDLEDFFDEKKLSYLFQFLHSKIKL
ncbi:hypothetical protein HK099_000192 [Clydaea vesicula]|uniref:Uncharacterized protein n=1 Tax=Clydaea vesicula TaxID=447962 RepID=A0AAD5U8W8_9FUNG|nr:hypothetical protein HK099_000192 [Clydaea vesicula]